MAHDDTEKRAERGEERLLRAMEDYEPETIAAAGDWLLLNIGPAYTWTRRDIAAAIRAVSTD